MNLCQDLLMNLHSHEQFSKLHWETAWDAIEELADKILSKGSIVPPQVVVNLTKFFSSVYYALCQKFDANDYRR